MNRRRRMMMSGKKVYVFKEGEGLVFGNVLSGDSGYSYCTDDFIHLSGRAWGTSTHDDDSAYSMLIDANPIEFDRVSFIPEGNGFDFSGYKTLNFEFALTTANSNFGYVGYGTHERMSGTNLAFNDNSFNENKLRELFRNGEKKAIVGAGRQIISFDISAKANGRIVLVSPLAYTSGHYAKIYNIWFE